MHFKADPSQLPLPATSGTCTPRGSPKKASSSNPPNLQIPTAPNLSQATTKFLGIQDVYQNAVAEMTQMRDRALGSYIQDLPKLQSEDIWLRMSSPPLDYRTPHPSPSQAAQPIVHGVDEEDEDCALLKSPLQPAWQGVTYVVYHGEHGSYAGLYQTWAELTPIVSQKMPFTKSSIFKKFHSFEQAQRSLSQLSGCGVIEALRFQIPGDGYECWVVTRGHKPGIYISRDGLGHGTGAFQYFSGPSTKKRAEAYMKTAEKSGNVARLARSIFPEKGE
ncbi:hypothetical protein C8J56DRAFT_1060946 [Mycena floridula]|nr:hypothetical protein C8J56DRAFT_1060946 [Mycena floridula]